MVLSDTGLDVEGDRQGTGVDPGSNDVLHTTSWNGADAVGIGRSGVDSVGGWGY
jgi:hypothetical protein